MTCDGYIERLVDGVRPGEDPQLAAHLGSCLRCYRAAADLRELPALQELLRDSREEENHHAEPGDAFWRSFSGQVSGAWADSRKRPIATPSPATPSGTVAAGLAERWAVSWNQLVAFWRRPMPAAFAGAACAAAVAFVVVGPLRTATAPSGATAPRASTAALPTERPAGVTAPGSDEAPGGDVEDGLDESVGSLDDASLGAVLDSLDSSFVSELAASGGEVEVPPGTDLPATTEELDELDEQGLEALQADLGRSI